MPRPKSLPTPSSSTDLIAVDKNMEGAFTLPDPITPPSPTDNPRKRTSSGAVKKDEDLPPPPSRARKIIQMKPKSDSSDYSPPKTKRKQPSATSAAGRKIARKTAHSIIERRRRSKMNEEFGVLKDMIPACEGSEMHKLAILQAGIEYVKYLEDCVSQLKGEESPAKKTAPALTWEYRKQSTTSSEDGPSPDVVARADSSTSASATPTLLSPAFNAIHFSPDLLRKSSLHASPNILPLPQAMIREEKSPMIEGGAEATATAALMMLTNDRRTGMESGKAKGISVRDLLSS